MLRTYDPSDRVSPELSEILESLTNFAEALDLVTLGYVRAALATGDLGEAYDADRLHPDTVQSVLTELDDLIEEYGVRGTRGGFRVCDGQRGAEPGQRGGHGYRQAQSAHPRRGAVHPGVPFAPLNLHAPRPPA